MAWIRGRGGLVNLEENEPQNVFSKRVVCPVFTLHDMLEIMPSTLYVRDGKVVEPGEKYHQMTRLTLTKDEHGYRCSFVDYLLNMIFHKEDGDTAIEVAYNMLCWLAENKLLGKEEKK